MMWWTMRISELVREKGALFRSKSGPGPGPRLALDRRFPLRPCGPAHPYALGGLLAACFVLDTVRGLSQLLCQAAAG